MRDLSSNIVEAKIRDLDDLHVFYFRRPSNEELTAYTAALFVRKGGKIVNRTNEARIKFGKRIVTGFKKGSLAVDGKPFASDAVDPDYRAEWKELVERAAPELFAAIAQRAFESVRVTEDMAAELESDLLGLFEEEGEKTPGEDPTQ